MEACFVRPHVDGPVVVSLDNILPPFAKRVVGAVEIAHDEADDFEFALAVARSDMQIDTSRDLSEQVEVFSGWHRTSQRFVPEELSLKLDAAAKAHLSLVLAVRLPLWIKTGSSQCVFQKDCRVLGRLDHPHRVANGTEKRGLSAPLLSAIATAVWRRV